MPKKKKFMRLVPKNWDWSFTNFGNKKNSVFGLWFVDKFFQQNSVSAVVSVEGTAVKDVAPRMSCAVLAAAAW